MKFVNPHVFFIVPILIIGVLLVATLAGRRRKNLLRKLLGKYADDPQAVHLSYNKRRVRIGLLLAGMLTLTVAVSRPYWNTNEINIESKGRDIIVLFDLSKSMLATDLPPSRLEHGKFLLRRLIRRFAGDRFGLTVFAGKALLTCPLTSDPVTLEQYIEELSVETIPVGGTNLELALYTANKAFNAAEGKHRAVVVFTDGEELSGNAGNEISKLKNKNIPLLIIGLGDPETGAPIPEGNGVMKRDTKGNLIISKLNEQLLQKLAKQSKGIYVRSTVADPNLLPVEMFIDAMDKSAQTKNKHTVPDEKFPVFLFATLIFLFLYIFISERSCAILCFITAGILLTGATKNVKSEKSISESLPVDPFELYNYARKKQLSGETEAEFLFEKVLKAAPESGILQSRGLQNLGVISHQKGNKLLNEAFEAVNKQQLDQSLAILEQAKIVFDNSEELYTHALRYPEASVRDAKTNLAHLEKSRKQLNDLKEKIEKLKKQQQQARKQTKHAQQQQQQNKNQQNNQNSNKYNQPNIDQQIQQAQKSTQELKRQADNMKQKQISQQADKAQEELNKALQARKRQQSQAVQKHLDNAVQALEDNAQTPLPNDKNKQKQSNNKPPQETEFRPDKQVEKKEGNNLSSEQLLQLLKDEESKRRQEIKRSKFRPALVEKDW